tara:strand:+ start:341 stop:610 length:270 start_codon:yes stop_codon:yes gene_type:complete
MTEYKDIVEYRRKVIAAEDWANKVESLHAFDTDKVSMWYETNPEDGSVLDIRYNDGRIERQQNGKTIRVLGQQVTGKELVDNWEKANVE